MIIKQRADEQKEKYDKIANTIFEQDKKNYMINQQVQSVMNQLNDVKIKQNNLREQINILSMKQAQLIETIQKEPETVSH